MVAAVVSESWTLPGTPVSTHTLISADQPSSTAGATTADQPSRVAGPMRMIRSLKAPIIGGMAVGALFVPTVVAPRREGLVLCPFRLATGLWCPGCGMTRAAGWLAHGDFAAAWRLHPWIFPLAAQALLLGLVFLVLSRHHQHFRLHVTRLFPPVLAANGVALLVVWIIRLRTGALDNLG